MTWLELEGIEPSHINQLVSLIKSQIAYYKINELTLINLTPKCKKIKKNLYIYNDDRALG